VEHKTVNRTVNSVQSYLYNCQRMNTNVVVICLQFDMARKLGRLKQQWIWYSSFDSFGRTQFHFTNMVWW